MGSSHPRECAPELVAVECVSIVNQTLACLGDVTDEKKQMLMERIGRQASMIEHSKQQDVWFSLYYSVLVVASMLIDHQTVHLNDIRNMFGHLEDLSEDTRVQYDLATQILMIVHQMLRLALQNASLDITQRWLIHDSIRDSVQSALLRFGLLRNTIEVAHCKGLDAIFRNLNGLYDGNTKRPHATPIESQPIDVPATPATRTRTKSRKGTVSSPRSTTTTTTTHIPPSSPPFPQKKK